MRQFDRKPLHSSWQKLISTFFLGKISSLGRSFENNCPVSDQPDPESQSAQFEFKLAAGMCPVLGYPVPKWEIEKNPESSREIGFQMWWRQKKQLKFATQPNQAFQWTKKAVGPNLFFRKIFKIKSKLSLKLKLH